MWSLRPGVQGGLESAGSRKPYKTGVGPAWEPKAAEDICASVWGLGFRVPRSRKWVTST